MTDVDHRADPGSRAVDHAPEFAERLEPFRRELTGYCYRMLGSSSEAEDATQDALLKAWRSLDRFEGRSSLRSWLYRIATNTCFDMLGSRQRRARPMDLSSAQHADSYLAPGLSGETWIEPMPDGQALPGGDDPAERAVEQESIRLAFVTALQVLPPRQRAALILCDVLRWQATEVAQLLETSVASVNSALQRARATLADGEVAVTDVFAPLDAEQRALLDRYVDAFERYDMDALTALVYEDATMSMPPFALWLRGAADIRAWMLGQGAECQGSRLIPAEPANGSPTFGQYRVDPAGGHTAWALVVLELRDGLVVGINSFLDTQRLFPQFGLAEHLPDRATTPPLPA